MNDTQLKIKMVALAKKRHGDSIRRFSADREYTYHPFTGITFWYNDSDINSTHAITEREINKMIEKGEL